MDSGKWFHNFENDFVPDLVDRLYFYEVPSCRKVLLYLCQKKEKKRKRILCEFLFLTKSKSILACMGIVTWKTIGRILQ